MAPSINTSSIMRGLLWLLLAICPILAAAQSVDDAFDPDANGPISAINMLPDGKIIVVGDFTSIAGATRHRIARLNSDGSLDATFTDAYVDALIRAVVVQPDGRIVIGGNFHQVGAHTRSFLARLNGDGTIDDGFQPDADAAVYALVVQDDGKIIAGGKFESVGGEARHFLARLHADGSVDTGFDPNPDSTVLTLTAQGDGRLLAGGRFDSFVSCGLYNCITTFAGRIARINVDGSVDEDFDPDVNDGEVRAIVEQPDGAIVIAGTFTSIGSEVHQGIARLTAEGNTDSFFPAIYVDDSIRALALQEDGKILVGGAFTQIAGQSRGHLARLRSDGSLDLFVATTDGNVSALALQDDGALLIGGNFTSIKAQTRNRIARVVLPSGQGDLAGCTATPDFIVHDDGTLEEGYTVSVADVRFVDKFTPTAYPVVYNAVCIGFITGSGPTSYGVEIVVFDDDGAGGEPGTQLGSVAATVAVTLSVPVTPNTTVFWNKIDISSLGLQVTDGSVYIGARWVPSGSGLNNIFIATDQSRDRPAGFAEGYLWKNATWVPIDQEIPGYRSLMVRAGRDDTIFRDGFESP